MFLILLALLNPEPRCIYDYSVWNTLERRTSARIHVDKPVSALTEEEKGPFGCTPCLRDQQSASLSNGLSVTVCRHIEKQVVQVLNQSIKDGASIEEIIGYRASLSRGDADPDGNRTLLSFHAYGTAVDINESWNGLYDHCTSWGPDCRLIKGGPHSLEDIRSLTPANPLVVGLKKIGMNWGGELEGKQKDFMHFDFTK
jgi:hypothetical protein